MSVKTTIKSEWGCDWCKTKVVTEDAILPNGWVVANDAPGEHFCSYEHERTSADAWEHGIDAAMEAQFEVWEEIRQNWLIRP